ncbi:MULTISPECIES: hypothetical protein [unclassified Streptomyces]|jgi:hypothetical protein|uniref:hypothetical protein n=1 Tax=unclassified Streptomyces TaxID=2593676 RepID=UPI00368CDC61
MSDAAKVVKLYAKGAPVGVLDGGLVALPAPGERAAEWSVSLTDGGFRFALKGTDEVVTAAGTDRAPATVRPDTTEASVWRLQYVDAEGTTTLTSLADLRDGTYVIDRRGLALGRDLFEPRTPGPKPVVVRTDDRTPFWRVEILD